MAIHTPDQSRIQIHAVAILPPSYSPSSSPNRPIQWALQTTIDKEDQTPWYLRGFSPHSASSLHRKTLTKHCTGTLLDIPRSRILAEVLVGENDGPALDEKVLHILRNVELDDGTCCASSCGEKECVSIEDARDDGERDKEESSLVWLAKAVEALQLEGLVATFSIDGFVKNACDALQRRRNHQENIDKKFVGSYEKGYDEDGEELEAQRKHIENADAIEPDCEEHLISHNRNKALRQCWGGFWISHGPQSAGNHETRRLRERNSWEREDDPYGGLM